MEGVVSQELSRTIAKNVWMNFSPLLRFMKG